MKIKQSLFAKCKITLVVVLSFLTATMAMAQSTEVTGKVSDNQGLSLPGVNVAVLGTAQGTITKSDGTYTLAVPSSSSILSFSFVGFKTQEIRVGSQNVINVILQQNLTAMEEVVLVGYGTSKKENLTGAVASVDFEKAENAPAANTATLLQGRMSGVTVSSFNTQPGEDSPEISIRGVGTLNSGKNPLIIVDGIETSFDQIPASDIANVSVLKDAASASIYGVRAANGVILITTKRGKAGSKPIISLKHSYSLQEALIKPELLDSWDWAILKNAEAVNNGEDPLYTDEMIQAMRDGSDSDHFANTNWFNEMYDVAPMNKTYLSVAGGNEGARYMLSGEVFDQQGIMLGTSAKRYNLRSNIDVKVSDRINIGLNLSGNKRRVNETLNNASASNSDNDLNYQIRRFASPTVPVRYSNGEYGFVDGIYDITSSTTKNPVFNALRGENFTDRYYLNGKVFADVELLRGLKFKTNLSGWYQSSLTSTFSPATKSYDAEGNIIGQNSHTKLLNNNYTTTYYQNENLLTYDIDLGDHQINLLGGQSNQLRRVDYFMASIEDFPSNDIHELNAGINNKDVDGSAQELALSSYFGRVGYQFGGKYLLEANVRTDGTSRFAPENRWGVFPSFSAGWIISNESFAQNLGTVSFLKLRGSWGSLGNQDLGSNYYPYSQTISTGQNYLWGSALAPGVAITTLANYDLLWEKTTITDIGADMTLFNNRLQITADYFDKISSDVLFQLEIPLSMGNVSPPYQNVAVVRNYGWEADVVYKQSFGELFVSAGFNVTHVKNEVLDLGGEEEYIYGNTILRVGEPAYSYYGYVADGFYNSEEEVAAGPTQFGTVLPGDIRFVDISGPDGEPDRKIDATYDRQIIGNPFPEYMYAINLSAEYKGIDLYMFFQGISQIDRFYWYNNELSGNVTRAALDYWTPENMDATYSRWGNPSNNNSRSSYWLQDGSYLRLKNVELGYTFPSSMTNKVAISKLRIYFSGFNLLTYTDVPDYDPEKLTNDDRNRGYPQSKVISFGVQVDF